MKDNAAKKSEKTRRRVAAMETRSGKDASVMNIQDGAIYSEEGTTFVAGPYPDTPLQQWITDDTGERVARLLGYYVGSYSGLEIDVIAKSGETGDLVLAVFDSTDDVDVDPARAALHIRSDGRIVVTGGLTVRPDVFLQLPIVEDFYSIVVNTLANAAIGAGSAAVIAGTPHHPGQVRITQNGANTGYRFNSGLQTSYLAGGESTDVIFQAQSVSATVFRLGIQDSVSTTAPTNGAWVNIAATTLTGKTAAGGSTSTTASSYTISNTTWYRVHIAADESAANVDFELYTCADGLLVWSDTLSTNIPTIAGREVGPAAVAYKTTAGAVDLMDIDWLSFYGSKTLTR